MDIWWLLFAVGFVAQLVDGALGMAYGVLTNTALLAIGLPPAHASALVRKIRRKVVVMTPPAKTVNYVCRLATEGESGGKRHSPTAKAVFSTVLWVFRAKK